MGLAAYGLLFVLYTGELFRKYIFSHSYIIVITNDENYVSFMHCTNDKHSMWKNNKAFNKLSHAMNQFVLFRFYSIETIRYYYC